MAELPPAAAFRLENDQRGKECGTEIWYLRLAPASAGSTIRYRLAALQADVCAASVFCAPRCRVALAFEVQSSFVFSVRGNKIFTAPGSVRWPRLRR